MDLRDWDIEQEPAIRVGGELAFAWNALLPPGAPWPDEDEVVQVPGRWSDGVEGRTSAGKGTYSLTLELPEHRPAQLAIELRNVAGASRLHVDGVFAPPTGVVDPDPAEVVEDVRRRELVFPAEAPTAEVRIEAANVRHQASGIRRHLLIGTPEAVESFALRRVVGDVFTATSLATMGLLFLGLYWARRREVRHAWFAAMCLCFTVRLALAGEGQLGAVFFGGVPFWLRLAVEYASIPVSAYFGLSFVYSISLDGEPSRGARALLLGLALLALSTPLYMMVAPWGPLLQLLLLASMFSLVYGLFLATRAALRGDVHARPMAGALWVFMVAVAHDVGVTLDLLSTPMLLSSVAMLLGLLTQGVLLTRSQSEALTLVERLSGRLRRAHEASLRFVPIAFLERLGHHGIIDVERGEHSQQDMAVMFTDLRGFTTLTESWGSEHAFAFINRYLERMEPCITDQQGFVNQYLGDGIMALFPTAGGALAAARSLMSELDRFNSEDPDAPVMFGIGISAGPLMLGTIGSDRRLDGSVIGDTVNHASRVEGMTKIYGTRVLFDESVLHRSPEVGPHRLLDRVVARGRSSATRIYELLDVLEPEERRQKEQTAERFERGRRAYVQGRFHEALTLFRVCVEQAPLDQTAALYVARCERLLDGPPGSWEGVTVLDRK